MNSPKTLQSVAYDVVYEYAYYKIEADKAFDEENVTVNFTSQEELEMLSEVVEELGIRRNEIDLPVFEQVKVKAMNDAINDQTDYYGTDLEEKLYPDTILFGNGAYNY